MSSELITDSGDQDTCWICLDPLTTDLKTNPLIKCCDCNLFAHKRCLLNWASSVTLQHTQTEGEIINDSYSTENLPGFMTLNTLGLSSALGRSVSNQLAAHYTFTNPSLHCPQCRAPILFTQKPSLLLTLCSGMRELAKQGTRLGLTTYVCTGMLASAFTTGVASLVSIGFGLIWRQLAPQSVLLKILGITGVRDFEGALNKGKVGFTELGLLAGVPIYLLGLRGGHYSHGTGGLHPLMALTTFYPLFFYVKDANVLSNWEALFRSKDPRNWLLFVDPLSLAYNFCYNLTFNRLYRRWCLSVKPWFIKNRQTKEEVNEIEEEDTEMRELQTLRQEREQSQNYHNPVRSLINSIIPRLSKREREIQKSRSRREEKAIFQENYILPFIPPSNFLTALTTLTWPTLGSLINSLVLSKSTVFRSYLSTQTNTPDEATYLGNLIGCVTLVLIKDLVNLGVVYMKYTQLRDIDIIEPQRLKQNGVTLTINRPEDIEDQANINENMDNLPVLPPY